MTLSISGTVAVIGGDDTVGPLNLPTNTMGNSSRQSLTLTSGANTISIPTWAKLLLIMPNPSNGIGLTLKGVTGDTGIPISGTATTEIEFPVTPPSSLVLTAASNFTTVTDIWIY